VRLLLDHHLSARNVGKPLRRAGHDVQALSQDASAQGLPDEQVLELAVAEQRILVTRNGRHFQPLLRDRAEAGRAHAGAILIWTLDHAEFAAIVAGVERLLELYPAEGDWADLVVAF
jgi:uncharacterized protein with PIN domain